MHLTDQHRSGRFPAGSALFIPAGAAVEMRGEGEIYFCANRPGISPGRLETGNLLPRRCARQFDFALHSFQACQIFIL